jgi:hypothetical protein
VSAFYAFTKTPHGWKIFAMSSIEFAYEPGAAAG